MAAVPSQVGQVNEMGDAVSRKDVLMASLKKALEDSLNKHRAGELTEERVEEDSSPKEEASDDEKEVDDQQVPKKAGKKNKKKPAASQSAEDVVIPKGTNVSKFAFGKLNELYARLEVDLQNSKQQLAHFFKAQNEIPESNEGFAGKPESEYKTEIAHLEKQLRIAKNENKEMNKKLQEYKAGFARLITDHKNLTQLKESMEAQCETIDGLNDEVEKRLQMLRSSGERANLPACEMVRICKRDKVLRKLHKDVEKHKKEVVGTVVALRVALFGVLGNVEEFVEQMNESDDDDA